MDTGSEFHVDGRAKLLSRGGWYAHESRGRGMKLSPTDDATGSASSVGRRFIGASCTRHRAWWLAVLLHAFVAGAPRQARARLQRPELRLVLSLPAAVLLLERLQRFLRRWDDGASQRL